MVCTDVVLTRGSQQSRQLLLIKRLNHPFKDYWALPGGFVEEHEPLIEAAQRELHEETGISGVELNQFRAYGDKHRDPRGHCISVVFYGTVPVAVNGLAGDDAKELKWFNIVQLPPLAFDHQRIIHEAFQFLGF